MPDQPSVRVFISSPADVRPERLKAEQIVKRLNRELGHFRHIEAVLWEREPLVASHAFQDPENIPQPRLMNIVVVILWSRLGLLLPAESFRGAISKQPVTGTEWEFEDALAGARANGVPHLVLYRKTAEPSGGFGDRAVVEERLGQIEQVEAFIKRWFRSEGDESYTAAFHTFADTAEFEEKLYGHLRALLQRPPAGEHTIRWHEAPFRGLLSFEFEQAPVFFGRTRARNELRELLAQRAAAGCAFALVLGASGSGKSSLVKAGLLPDLILPGMIDHVGIVRWAVLRPSDAEPYDQPATSQSPPPIPLRVREGAGSDVGPAKKQAILAGVDPLDAVAAAIMAPTALPELAELQYTPQRLATLLRAAPAQAELPIRRGLAKAGAAAGLTQTAEARLALVIDQLEELFAVERFTQSGRETFVTALSGLARCGLVWVIATMRSDFFDRLETMPALVALSAEARFLLSPPDDPEITQIIRQPALEAGLRFEIDTERGIALDSAIYQAAVGQKGALPLLSFLLDQLWRRRDETGQLTFGAYEDLGGLEGAIGRRAEEVFLSQPQVVQNQFVPVLRALVTVEGARVTSRPAPLSQFPPGTPRRQLVDALLHPDERLLVAEDPQAHERNMASPRDQARLRLAHEALLTHWPRARDQIAADARDLELRGRLEEDAARWEAAPTRRDQRDRTATGLLLAEAWALRGRWGAELPAGVRSFIAASHRAARQRRLRLAGMLIGALLALPLTIMFIWAGLVWWGVSRVEAEWAAEDLFIRIPPMNLAEPYCFNMGSPDGEPDRSPNEGPVHRVCLKPFELGKYVVTQVEWNQVMILPWLATTSYFPGQRRPVDGVSWDDAQLFIRLMSFFGRYKYRLPSEAEWEYAARAGTITPFFWGHNVDDGCAYAAMADVSLGEVIAGARPVDCHYPKPTAPSDDTHGSEGLFEIIRGTTEVGSLNANQWGLYDMSGNVFEWVADCYVDSYVGAPTDGSMVSVGDCNTRVVRGGSFDFNPMRGLRTAHRNKGAPVFRFDYVGVRVVRTK